MPDSTKASLMLIIDDSVETIRLLSGMLKDFGQILFAMNGHDGIELAKQRHPDLILLDVEMSSMNGYDVCRQLKAHEDSQRCAVIFVTAHNNQESEVAALEAGAVDFITKPLNPPVVRARVQTHLRLQHHTNALAKLVHRDGLTSLYNRRYFDTQLENEFSRHTRQKLPIGLALIDIDHFKSYNDGYGHQEGDECLKKLAKALIGSTRRPGEIVARYGGEEFVVILPYTSLDDAEKYGEWICQIIESLHFPHAYSPTADHITISVGLTSHVPTPGFSIQNLIKTADDALYKAKSAGRNCSHILPYQSMQT